MRRSEKSETKCTLICCLLAGGLVLAILWALFLAKGYAPSGENSLAWEDGNYQYLDLFSYLKDVFDGKNSIVYSFSKGLGGGMFGVFSYYLSSPLNILIKAFDKSDIIDFFDILVSLKLSLAAAASALFFNIRFRERKKRNREYMIIILLSVCYALGQYSIAQASNIMWLDGVYMLPLILSGVYTLVSEGKMALLSVTVAASILFNWYTAGINCIFSGGWFVLETALAMENRKEKLKYALGKVLCFSLSGLAGVLISGILFLPMIGSITKSSKGILSTEGLFEPNFIGGIFPEIGNYIPGVKSQFGEVSLYCGSFAALGCCGLLFSKDIPEKRRIKLLCLLLFTALTYIWRPFVSIFSLFKTAGSYWYRYSYTGIFSIVFISSCYFMDSERKTISRLSFPCGIAVAFIIAYYNLVRNFSRIGMALLSSALILLCAVLIRFIYGENRSKRARKYGCALLAAMILSEAALGAALQMDNYHMKNAYTRKMYSAQAEKRWDELKVYDAGEYRTAQTCTYSKNNNKGITANLNEPLAFHYRGITSYTSYPEENTLSFMKKVGYPVYAGTLNEVLAPILGVYSMLGVKYVASDEPFPFLEKTEVSEESEINIYRNVYAFPLAFRYTPALTENREPANPFEYQNDLFAGLTGKEESLYYPLDYTVKQKENDILYTVDAPDNESVIYGFFPFGFMSENELFINGEHVSKYGGWLSQYVFYVPVKNGRAEVILEQKDKEWLFDREKDLFYAIRLDLLKEAAEEAEGKQADRIELKNADAHFHVESPGKENLLVSIPYDSDWKVERNGKTVETELFGDYLYSIPLTEGENDISFRYNVRYLPEGMVCTAAGLLLLTAEIVFEKKKRKNAVSYDTDRLE